MGTTAQKLAYTKETKEKILKKVNYIDGEITDETTFREGAEKLFDLYNSLPKIEGEGSSFSLENTRKGKVISLPEGNSSQDSLPDGYAALTYIESSGEQYIDTGINADYKLSLVTEFAYTDTTNSQSMGAIRNDSGTYLRHHFIAESNRNSYFYSNATSKQFQNALDINKHKYFIDMYNKILKFDNNEQIEISYTNFDVNMNYWVFGRNSNQSSLIRYSSIKLYNFKMYYEDVLVREFIPCKNNNNEVGLYDLVTKAFFANQGTGTFTAGDEISFPNPDFPQNVNVVKGNNIIKIEGVNKFNHLEYPVNEVTDFGITVTNNGDGSFTLNGTSTKDNKGVRLGSNEVIQNLANNNIVTHTLYYISGTNTKASSSNNKNVLRLNYNQPNSMIHLENLETQLVISKTQAKYTSNVGWDWTILVGMGDSFDNFTVKYQLNIGDAALPYEPYIQPKEFDLDLTGKNKFDINNITENTFITEQGQTGSSQVTDLSDFIKIIDNNKYTLSYDYTTLLNSNIRSIVYYDENKNFISGRRYSPVYKTLTVTTPNNAQYLRFSYDKNCYNILLEESPTATPYEPHYNYELAGIDEYKDLLFKNEPNNPNYNSNLDENEWYIKRNMEKYVYNNDLTSNGTATGRVRLLTPELNIEANLSVADLGEIALCNLMNTMVNLTGLNGTTNSKKIRIEISTVFASSEVEAKQLFADKNLTIYYGAETPTYEKIPNNITLYNQLEELNSYIGQGGTLVIETESEEENAQLIVKASALKDWEVL